MKPAEPQPQSESGGDRINRQKEFEILLTSCQNALERYVCYKAKNRHDADDLLQDIRLIAYEKYATLIDKAKFKQWLLTIARNKLTDYYVRQAGRAETALDESVHIEQPPSQPSLSLLESVRDTLSLLTDGERQVLMLHYLEGLPLKDIAARTSAPLGTVKSRLHYAKRSFQANYPYLPRQKGVLMSILPPVMPDVKIEKLDLPVFPVRWAELMGWVIIPRLNETAHWGIYDYPRRTLSEAYELEVTGRASVHGVEGVEIIAKETNSSPAEHQNDNTTRTFVAQLTDTHSRFLLESHVKDGVHHTYTFLDEEFGKNWGYGRDNCGNAIHPEQKGIIVKDNDVITAKREPALDVVGRYRVTLGGKEYDTILVMDIETYDGGMMSETYLDRNGRTILWRRFNRNEWAYDRYQRLWAERLPENEKVTINGETFVHWYSCLTDYVL